MGWKLKFRFGNHYLVLKHTLSPTPNLHDYAHWIRPAIKPSYQSKKVWNRPTWVENSFEAQWVPGCSVEHYIIKMMDLIMTSLDRDSDAAMLSVAVDYRKAFNRILHSNILCRLAALNVPTGAIRIIKSYPGGALQGGLLTCVFFILQVNKAGSPCTLTRIVLPVLGSPTSRNIIVMNSNHHITEDQSELPSLRKDNVIPHLCHNQDKLHTNVLYRRPDPPGKDIFVRPQTKEKNCRPSRFNLTLLTEKSALQHQFQDLVRYTAQQSMLINEKKTKCLPFILSQTNDFQPDLNLEEGEYLEVGLVITSGLTWEEHVIYTITRVNNVLCHLTNFKQEGSSEEKLLKF